MPPKPISKPAGGDLVLDFSGVKPFDPLPETNEDGSTAIYKVRLDKLTRAKSKEGKPMSVAEFGVIAPEAFKKRKLFRNFSLQPQALPFLYNLLKAVDPKVKLGEDFVYNEVAYQGLECAVSVENHPYEEQVRSAPKNIYPVSKYVEE